MVSAVRARGAGGWRSFLEFYLALALLCFPFKAIVPGKALRSKLLHNNMQ